MSFGWNCQDEIGPSGWRGLAVESEGIGLHIVQAEAVGAEPSKGVDWTCRVTAEAVKEAQEALGRGRREIEFIRGQLVESLGPVKTYQNVKPTVLPDPKCSASGYVR